MPGVSYRSPFSWTGACVPCPSSGIGLLALYLAVTAAVALIVYSLARAGFAVAPVLLTVELMQLLAIVGTVEVRVRQHVGDDAIRRTRSAVVLASRVSY